MAHGISLTRFAAEPENHRYLGAYRLRVEASDPTDYDDAGVFLYERSPAAGGNLDPIDTYLGVCSPVDLAEFPYEAPEDDATPAFFRLSYFELDFRSTGEATDHWTLVQEQICLLTDAMDRLAVLVEQETVRCGEELADSESSSSSESE